MNKLMKRAAKAAMSEKLYTKLQKRYREYLAVKEYIKVKNMESMVEKCLQNIRDNNHMIDLGRLLSANGDVLKPMELTYISGGSGVLDYAFILEIARLFGCQSYCEIGSYIGESVNVASMECMECHFITAGDSSPWSIKNYNKKNNRPDYSCRLAQGDNIIPHFCMDSKIFDYSQVPQVDLYFIDADHSYKGVKADTQNVFAHKKDDAIVIWHDITNVTGLQGGVLAVREAIGAEFRNFFITDNNACGIYLPKEYQGKVPKRKFYYSDEPQPLWVYDTNIKLRQV